MTKTKSSTSTKQKVIAAVATVAVLAGLVGLVSAIGKANGLNFGAVFFKRTAIIKKTSEDKKTSPPVVRLCKIRSTTGGIIKVPCAQVKKTK